MSQKFCPECGGALFYEPQTRRFVCKGCGLYVTREELAELRGRLRREESEDRRRKRERDEYIEWWLSTKK